MDNIFKKLEKSFLFDKKHNTILGVIEALLAVLSGAFIHGLITKYNSFDLWFSIITTVLFLYLFYRRLSKETHFSVSGLGELHSTMQLHDAKRDIERKNLIDGYIDDAIKSLNANTCNYNEVNVDNHLCDQSLSLGLKSVCQPYFDNPQNLLNTPRAKFTVGAYVNWFQKLPPTMGTRFALPIEDHDVFILRDDCEFKDYLGKEILNDPFLVDLSFFFQNQFRDTFRHSRYIHSYFSAGEKNYSIITAPIPTVCEDDSLGVLFIICQQLNEVPQDLENVTHIFCRLFSNWLSRYNECVSDRCEKANTAFQRVVTPVVTPQEVTAQKQETNGSPIS